MPAEVVDLQLARWERRAKAEDAAAAKLPPLAVVIQAEVGAVRFIVGNEEEGIELGLSEEQAFSMAQDLWNAARASAEARRARADRLLAGDEPAPLL